MITKRVCTVILLLSFSISMAFADETKSYQFDATEVHTLKVDVSIGSIIVEHTDLSTINIDMTLREDSNGWFRRSADLSSMDLDYHIRDSVLSLGFDEKRAKADLHIRIPATHEMSITLGVGTVELLLAQSDLIEVDLGVGSIEIDMLQEFAGDIELSAGVGETSVTGAGNVKTNRAFVSSDLFASGQGNSTVYGNVGVGSVSISLL